jgi:hypothetical protein
VRESPSASVVSDGLEPATIVKLSIHTLIGTLAYRRLLLEAIRAPSKYTIRMSTVSIRRCRIWQAFLLLYGLLITLFVGQGLAPGVVVCLQTNGHLQVEPTHKYGPFRTPADAHQGSCLDFSMSSRQLSLEKHSTLDALDLIGSAGDLVFVASQQLTPLIDHPLPSIFLLQPERIRNLRITFLHTIVLVI